MQKETKKADISTLNKFKRLIDDAKERYQSDYDRQFADVLFRDGSQWDSRLLALRSKKKRPVPVLNITRRHVERIVSSLRMNPFGINVDGDFEEGIDQILRAKIRKIEKKARMKEAIEFAVESAVTCGRGFVVVDTKFMDAKKTKLSICVSPVTDFRSVMIDPMSKEVDGSDMEWAIKLDSDVKSDHHGEQKDYAFKGMSLGKNEVGTATLWELIEGEDGNNSCKITKLEGDLITFEETLDIPYVPVIPFYGMRYQTDSHCDWTGEVSRVSDVQRAINYYYGSEIELASKAPKAPILASKEQVSGLEEQYKNLATDDPAVLLYNSVSTSNGSPLPPPTRMDNVAQNGFLMQSVEASMRNFSAVTGVLNDAMETNANDQSGKAVLLRQSAQERGSVAYLDNGAQSVEQIGRIVTRLIPKVCDYMETVEVETEQGIEKIQVNFSQLPIDWDSVEVNVSAGPSYEARRKENLNMMIDLAQKSGNFNMMADLIANDIDSPNAKKLAKRFAKLLPPELKDDAIDPMAMQAIQSAENALQAESQKSQMLEQALQTATQQIQSLEWQMNNNDRVLLTKTQMDNETKLSIARMQAEAGLTKQMMANEAKTEDNETKLAINLQDIEAQAKAKQADLVASYVKMQSEEPPIVVAQNDQFAGISDNVVNRDTGSMDALSQLGGITDGQPLQ